MPLYTIEPHACVLFGFPAAISMVYHLRKDLAAEIAVVIEYPTQQDDVSTLQREINDVLDYVLNAPKPRAITLKYQDPDTIVFGIDFIAKEAKHEKRGVAIYDRKKSKVRIIICDMVLVEPPPRPGLGYRVFPTVGFECPVWVPGEKTSSEAKPTKVPAEVRVETLVEIIEILQKLVDKVLSYENLEG